MRPAKVKRFGGFDATCVAGVVLAAFLAYVLVCRAGTGELRKLMLTTKEASAQVADIDEVRTALDDAQERVKTVEERLQLLHKRMPDELDLDGFLKDIHKVATDEAVVVAKVRPGEISEQESYREVPVAVDAKGRFKDLYDFITALRTMPRLTTIEGIDIGLAGDRLCESSLTLKIYAYKDSDNELNN